MRKENFAEAFGEINEKHIVEARADRKAKKPVWLKWGAMAACLCLVMCGGVMLNRFPVETPDPDLVQVANPIMEVGSLDEMEQYLDFDVPLLDKEVEAYVVLVVDGYPEAGRVFYTDGSLFSIKYGSGDISGIHGGKVKSAVEVDGVKVTYYTYDSGRYAIWESDGFTYSLTGAENLEEEVKTLISQSRN